MVLDKETALKYHRAMWNAIAEQSERLGHPVEKTEFPKYITAEDTEDTIAAADPIANGKCISDCFCCTYTGEGLDNPGYDDQDCRECPVIWETVNGKPINEAEDYDDTTCCTTGDNEVLINTLSAKHKNEMSVYFAKLTTV